ncbi:hypothetical protein GCHA_4250 [Paraglaciecola chathamensis S18K6]|uniref:Uncharacterized protein n=2 Tax=Paraglaciecola chathamensis TaxID=368405 RepID=A0AAV3V5P5_9ALTE|nr:hypothetical protein GCHA_4250 [Paraglaciecola chathamensis S18K6]
MNIECIYIIGFFMCEIYLAKQIAMLFNKILKMFRLNNTFSTRYLIYNIAVNFKQTC